MRNSTVPVPAVQSRTELFPQSRLTTQETGSEPLKRGTFQIFPVTRMRNADQQSGAFLKSLSVQIPYSVTT